MIMIYHSGVGRGRGHGGPGLLTFYLGGRNIVLPPLKTDLVTVCKVINELLLNVVAW